MGIEKIVNKHERKDGEKLYIVRLYDGFDYEWMDVSEPVPLNEAERIWNEKTDSGTRRTSFDDIDYYKIFPADTKMLYRAKEIDDL